MAKKPKSLPAVLKDAIRKSGMTPYELEWETGVHRGSISRFLEGRHMLRLDRAAQLCDYLELELRPKTRSKRKS